jgi:hypothetical protein
LLWMVVVPASYSILKVLNWGLFDSLWLTCLLLVVGAVRILTSARRACVTAVVIAIAYWAVVGSIGGRSPQLPFAVRTAAPEAIKFCVAGIGVFTVVEVLFRFLDWADNLMRTKTDD